MRIAVVLNSGAGSVDDATTDAAIRRAVEQAGAVCSLVRASGPDLVELTRRAAADHDVVAAAGGDGTMNAVATALVGTETPMGVLPMGTLNHFARDLGIPLDIEAAAAVLVHGRPDTIDVADVNGRVFLNNSSIGIYPMMVRDRDQQRQTLARGKWPAMAVAALNVLRRYPSMSVAMHTAEGVRHYRTPFVFVGNNVYSTELPAIGSRTSLQDGVLSVLAVRGNKRLQMLELLWHLLWSKLPDAAAFDVYACSEVTLNIPRRRLDVSFDGEVMRERSPLHYRIRPRALTVVLPQPPVPA